jgi:hypothetical protein
MQMGWVLTPEGHWAVAGLVAVALLLQAACVLWWHGTRVKRLDARVAQLSAALALLTDTVEAGFQDVLKQTAPAAEKRPVVPSRAANARRRIRSAAKRGKPVEQIAAAEQLSEGEVRLMLQMSGGPQSEPAHHAEMR